ncbi:hypothetical protein GPECTOR_6g517 [Gonium pectorale]|uniref:Uncharacterized protein n=1 Tax=Gonium pectorale TaxID=33097 RepID=A0A150GW60_GONPE|nr:hypothetical protein GPECTOR_6g517 [Gonium pectorale]|eukprot:KXZ53600.1 hypothetical protein GPECTOR_6g517 [Gonium pectorale]
MADWRSGLHDISNLNAAHGRGRSGGGKSQQAPQSDAELFIGMIEAGGVRCWGVEHGGVAGMLEVVDPRQLRRHLEGRLQSDAALRRRWLEGLQTVCEDLDTLHRALLPMALAAPPSVGSVPGSAGGMGGGGGGGSCGDSLIRCILSVACLQTPVASWLLQRLPVLVLEGGDEGGQQAQGREGEEGGAGSVPGLILSQLRWT